ncbi:hypothetical protein PMAYCL1PPCAC_00338 [Pristionchus mayeri]|uniref:Phosphatidylinositol 4-kinase beta n=1 Tax=Pristionchus mayeri TaxID=1317129 RepID=A0AAN4YX76_9BILA|nr:hypothetical protein PMAYCL1PPCAC_00338 [Pristionchus mayeri]
MTTPHQPDCKHSANGVCSKCVLFRSFNLSNKGRADSTEKENAVSVPIERRDSTASTSKSTPTVLSLDAAPLTESLRDVGQFRLLPVSSLDSPSSTPRLPTRSAAHQALDPAQLSMVEDASLTSSRESESPPALRAEEGGDAALDTSSYTSFSELRSAQAEARLHQKNSSPASPPPSTASIEGVVPRASNWLLRLLESELCDASMTLQYLHSEKSKGVISYLGNKLFKLQLVDVDTYIPQMVNLLLTKPDVAESIKPYLMERCKSSVQFALDCSWLLEAYNHDQITGVLPRSFTSEAESFRKLILSDFKLSNAASSLHQRCASEAAISSLPLSSVGAASIDLSSSATVPSGLRRVESSLSTLRHLGTGTKGTLPNGMAFDNGCECFDDYEVVKIDDSRGSEEEEDARTMRAEEEAMRKCSCGADRLLAEQLFMRALTGIGDRLRLARNKKEKSHRLISELHILNAHLPARVWIPLYATSTPHIVLRIPPEGGCVLNSKDKAPYCIYVEVLQCEDPSSVKVPPRLSETEAELHERLSALTRGSPPTGGGGGMMGGGVTEEYGGPPSRGGITEIRVVDCSEEGGEGGSATSAAAAANENNWVAAEDSLSEQRSMDSWNDSINEERTISPADIRRRLKEWVKKPRRQMRHTPDDPSAHAMSEPWEDKRERLRLASPYGRLPGWQLLPTIVKTGDDLRQELLAYQLLRALDSVWQEEGIPLVLRPYKILVLSHDSGMIEPIVNACSLHQIKRNLSAVYAEEGRADAPSLLGHFIDCFGPAHSDAFMTAQTNLVRSTAAYSLACYFLQVKDRHNGNILIDSDGRLIHIDFGFILSASPRNLGFETSPFKLTTEIIEVMGGLDSDMFRYYKLFMLQGLVAARKHIDRIMNIVEIMIHGSPLACFRAGEACIKAMRDRFHLTATDKQLEVLVDRMVEESRDSLRTRLYDNYQYYSNGIL